MARKYEILIFLLFLIFFSVYSILSISSDFQSRKERKENRPKVIDSLFNDLSLYGELIANKKFKSAGRPTGLCCIRIIDSSVDSLYVFNRKMRIAFKIEKDLATIVGCFREYENLKFVDINSNYPGMITWYDDSLNVIRQYPMYSAFGTNFIYEQDLRLCDHLIQD